MRIKANILLIIVAIIWGSGFIFSQIALDAQMSPVVILSMRFLLAFLVLEVVFFKKLKSISKVEWIGGSVVGCFLYIAFAFQILGLEYTTPSSNAFLTAINVIIVPLIYWAWYHKKPQKSLWIGCGLAILGIGLLTVKEGFKIGLGDILSLVCSIGFALHIFFTGYYSEKVGVEKLMVIQMGIASMLGGVVALVFGREELLQMQFTTEALVAVGYLGIMSTCIAFFLQTYAQKHTGSVETAIILSGEALFATLFSVVLGYEALSGKIIIGGILISSATIIAEFGNSLWKKIIDMKRSA